MWEPDIGELTELLGEIDCCVPFDELGDSEVVSLFDLGCLTLPLTKLVTLFCSIRTLGQSLHHPPWAYWEGVGFCIWKASEIAICALQVKYHLQDFTVDFPWGGLDRVEPFVHEGHVG